MNQGMSGVDAGINNSSTMCMAHEMRRCLHSFSNDDGSWAFSVAHTVNLQFTGGGISGVNHYFTNMLNQVLHGA